MQPDERNSGAPKPPKPGNVEMVRRTRAVQVMLSLPAARPVDRREVIGKGRNILAREQARIAREAAAAKPEHPSAPQAQPRPGCGAWWEF
jgi:hypothetical protein